jgi:hypothetical protein
MMAEQMTRKTSSSGSPDKKKMVAFSSEMGLIFFRIKRCGNEGESFTTNRRLESPSCQYSGFKDGWLMGI